MTGTAPGNVAAIVLAAGASTRMGRPKQLIEFRGKPLVVHEVDVVIEAGAQPVVVVVGAHAEQVRPALENVRDISIVLNREWETGIASSLTAGLRALAHKSWDGVLVTLADQPLVSAVMLRRLLSAFHEGARVVASSYGGAPGVPAVFGAERVPELLDLTGDAGAARWLRSRPRDVTVVSVDGLFDVDTPADVERLAAGPGSG